MRRCLLFLVDKYQWQGTGLEHSAVRICRGLNERGYEVHVLCEQGEPHEGVNIHYELNQVESLKYSINPELVIDWGFHHPADIHRMGAGTHEGYLRHYMEAYHGLQRRIKRIERFLPKHQRVIRSQRHHLSNPNAWFLANSHLTASMAVDGGACPERVEVIHQHVDRDEFDEEIAASHRHSIRKSWGVRDSEVVFLFVAHNLRLKNFDLLRRIFERGNLGSAKLVVIGKRKPRYRAPWLIYGGLSAEMISVYGGADALVHPTFFDSCANVALEAASCGLPVLVSRTSGINEIFPDEWGINVQGDILGVVTQWEKAMRNIALDCDLRNALGEKGSTVAKKYPYKAFLDNIESFIKKVSKDRE